MVGNSWGVTGRMLWLVGRHEGGRGRGQAGILAEESPDSSPLLWSRNSLRRESLRGVQTTSRCYGDRGFDSYCYARSRSRTDPGYVLERID